MSVPSPSFPFSIIISMEFVNSIAHSYSVRMQPQYLEINEGIGRLIDDLGGKVQKELVALEERALLGYKETLLSTQNAFRELKQGRNDQVIKQNTLALKAAQEKSYQQATEKALQMNRVYDRLKVEAKQIQEYSHQLQLQLKFLSKQTKLARSKAQALENEIRTLQARREKETVSALQRNQSCKKITQGSKEEEQPQREARLYQRRLRDKIEQLKDFLEIMGEEEGTLQGIFGRFDFESCRTQREKTALFMQVFQERDFKRFIYRVLFSKRQSSTASLSISPSA